MEWQQIQKKYQIETLCAKVLADKNLEDEKLQSLRKYNKNQKGY